MSATAATKGIRMLSLMGNGMVSTIMPMIDAAMALEGDTKRREAAADRSIPATVPSSFLALLWGNTRLPNFFPTSRAVPSPRVSMVMAANPVRGG